MTFWGKHRLGGLVSGAMLVCGLAMTSAVAQQTTVSDAQVESNVLKALSGAPELSTQNIQSTTVYGTVTLSGNVHDEAMRTKAENLVARAPGVTKVVDELTLGDGPAPQQAAAVGSDGVPPGQVLQSDGTYAPAPADQNDPGPPAQADNQPGPPPAPQGDYPGGPPRRPLYQGYAPPAGAPGGQPGGVAVTVPPGSVLQIRINRGLNSQHIQPGTPFIGTVMTDVVANGMVAIPRGATVQGVVVDAQKTGALKGKGELALQINGLTLGGSVYPLSSEVWQRQGRDKTASTVNHAVGLGALGALFGAAAGGWSRRSDRRWRRCRPRRSGLGELPQGPGHHPARGDSDV